MTEPSTGRDLQPRRHSELEKANADPEGALDQQCSCLPERTNSDRSAAELALYLAQPVPDDLPHGSTGKAVQSAVQFSTTARNARKRFQNIGLDPKTPLGDPTTPSGRFGLVAQPP